MDGSSIEQIKKLVEDRIVILSDGKEYSPVKLNRIIDQPQINTIPLKTITGLIDYIKSDKDKINIENTLIVISDYDSIQLLTNVEDLAIQRRALIDISLPEDGNNFPFGKFIDNEDFIIKLNSLFQPNDDISRLLTYTSRLTIQDAIDLEDDGITQKATVKRGASGAIKDKESSPSVVSLIPYRTFREIQQPESKFLFRLRSNGPNRMPDCALFEADGGAWKIQAIKNIKEYLQTQLTGKVIIA